jgi:hypothetical protein
MKPPENILHRVEILMQARFLFCEGHCGTNIDNITVCLDGKNIGDADLNFVNFRFGGNNSWKYENEISDISKGEHLIEIQFNIGRKNVARIERKVPFNERKSCQHLKFPIDADCDFSNIRPGIILLEHPSLDSIEIKNVYNKQIFEHIAGYFNIYDYQLILVTFRSKLISDLGFKHIPLPGIEIKSEIMEDITFAPEYQTVREKVFESICKTTGNSLVNHNLNPIDENNCKETILERAVQFECLLRKLKPKLLITWCEFNARTPLLRSLTDVHKIPSVVTHEGFLPQTLQIDKGGEIARSYPCRKHKSFQTLHVDKTDLERADEFLAVSIKKGSRNQQVPVPENTIKRINQARENGKKILFYVGCNDWLMGMRPIWLDHEESKASPFIDTYDALNELIRLAWKNNWHLIFKPHPHYNSALLQQILKKHIDFKDITISYSGNIFEFISVADVVITLMSSASYESLLYNVPVVLLGIHPMFKKGIAFECTHCSELETVIEMAIKRECWSEKKKAWKLFLARMIKYYLFPQSEDIATLMNKSIDEAARFLLKQVKLGQIKPL